MTDGAPLTIRADPRPTLHGNYQGRDYSLRKITRIADGRLVLNFDGGKTSDDYAHTLYVVLKDRAYNDAFHICAGPQGRLGMDDPVVTITPDVLATIDALAERIIHEK